MATREVLIERKQGLKASYCAFSLPNGDMRAAARRNMRFSNYWLLAAVLAGLAASLFTFPQLRDLPYSERVSGTLAFLAFVMGGLQIVVQSTVKVEYRGNDGLVCIVRNDRFSFSKPSSFRMEIPESDVDIALRFSRKGDATVEVAGKNALTVKRVRGSVVARTPPLHLDFKDRAGRTAVLDQSPEQRHTYRLVYDEEFTPEWLLFIMVATLLLR